MIKKKSQSAFDLDTQPGLTFAQWKEILLQIGRQAHAKVNGPFSKEEKQQARMVRRQIQMLWRQLKAKADQSFGKGSGNQMAQGQGDNRVIPVGPRPFTLGDDGRGPGSGAGYPADRDGREYRSDTDALYGNKSPIGLDINLDQTIWSDVQPNPRATINLNDFARTGGRVLADYYFGGESLSKQQADQLIFNYLRNRGLYRNAQLRWDSRSDSSVLLVPVMSPQPGRPPTWSTYSFEQAVNASRVGETYDELFNKFSRANSFDLFRRFAISLKREISKKTRKMIQDRVNPVLLKDARTFGPMWVGVLNARIRDLA